MSSYAFIVRYHGKLLLWSALYACLIVLVATMYLIIVHPHTHARIRGAFYTETTGRRQLLESLVEARTPNDLWYQVKVMCLKEQVYTESEARTHRQLMFLAYAAFRENETAERIQKSWELGRASILRELIEKRTVGEQWDEILQLYRGGEVDIDEVMGDPPVYEV